MTTIIPFFFFPYMSARYFKDTRTNFKFALKISIQPPPSISHGEKNFTQRDNVIPNFVTGHVFPNWCVKKALSLKPKGVACIPRFVCVKLFYHAPTGAYVRISMNKALWVSWAVGVNAIFCCPSLTLIPDGTLRHVIKASKNVFDLFMFCCVLYSFGALIFP